MFGFIELQYKYNNFLNLEQSVTMQQYMINET